MTEVSKSIGDVTDLDWVRFLSYHAMNVVNDMLPSRRTVLLKGFIMILFFFYHLYRMFKKKHKEGKVL